MLLSMTGFGRAQYEDEQVLIRVDIKSVNSKLFDLKLKLPLDFSYKEAWLRSNLQRLISRGKVDCYITVERYDTPPYKLNKPVAKQYFSAISELAGELGYKVKKINALEIIMRLPDVLRPVMIEQDEETWAKIYSTVEKAVEELIEFRRQEGLALEKDLLQHVDNIEAFLKQVPQYEQERIDRVKDRILTALGELSVEYDKERFEQEMIYYLEKYDISEEKVRLQNHINYFRETINGSNEKPVGKTLGFIAQEMGREINTMGSKANHFAIQQIVVKMKDELEKIKEQLANVL